MARESTDPMTITSAVAPDLDVVAHFIREMVSKGALVVMIQAILALLSRMRDLQTEIASATSTRPPRRCGAFSWSCRS
jgi:phage-related minor tail protein